MTTSTHTPFPTQTLPATPTVRRNMEAIADKLGRTLGEHEDAGLAIRISGRVPATIAPGRNNRLVAMFMIAKAEQVPSTLWISALSEAAGWGIGGEHQRFVVVDGYFTLLWTTPALPERELLDQLYELFATAVALAAMAGSVDG